jgi:hypothetical protein
MGFNENLNLIEQKVKFAKINKKNKIKKNINQTYELMEEIHKNPTNIITGGVPLKAREEAIRKQKLLKLRLERRAKALREAASNRELVIKKNQLALENMMNQNARRKENLALKLREAKSPAKPPIPSIATNLENTVLVSDKDGDQDQYHENRFFREPQQSIQNSEVSLPAASDQVKTVILDKGIDPGDIDLEDRLAIARRKLEEPAVLSPSHSESASASASLSLPPSASASLSLPPSASASLSLPPSASASTSLSLPPSALPVSPTHHSSPPSTLSTPPSTLSTPPSTLSALPSPSTVISGKPYENSAGEFLKQGINYKSINTGSGNAKHAEDKKPDFGVVNAPYPKELKIIPKKYQSDMYATAKLELEKNETKEATANLSKYISEKEKWNRYKYEKEVNKLEKTAQEEIDIILGIQGAAAKGFGNIMKEAWGATKSGAMGAYNIVRLPQVVMIFYVVLVLIIIICIILFIINLGNNNNNSGGFEIRANTSNTSNSSNSLQFIGGDFETSILPSLSWNGFLQSHLSHVSIYIAGQFSKYKYDLKYIMQKLNNLNFNIRNSQIIRAVTGNSVDDNYTQNPRSTILDSNDNIEYIDSNIMDQIDNKYNENNNKAKPLLKPKNIEINFPYNIYINAKADMSNLTEEEKNIYNEVYKRSINDTDNIIFKWAEVNDGTYEFDCDPKFVNNNVSSNLLEEYDNTYDDSVTLSPNGGKKCIFKTI